MLIFNECASIFNNLILVIMNNLVAGRHSKCKRAVKIHYESQFSKFKPKSECDIMKAKHISAKSFSLKPFCQSNSIKLLRRNNVTTALCILTVNWWLPAPNNCEILKAFPAKPISVWKLNRYSNSNRKSNTLREQCILSSEKPAHQNKKKMHAIVPKKKTNHTADKVLESNSFPVLVRPQHFTPFAPALIVKSWNTLLIYVHTCICLLQNDTDLRHYYFIYLKRIVKHSHYS